MTTIQEQVQQGEGIIPLDENAEVILETRGLAKHFELAGGFMGFGTKPTLKAVDGIDVVVRAGETVGLVGESGCGKSTTAKLLLGLEKPTDGQIFFKGEDFTKMSRAAKRDYRKNVQAVFQDPWSSLNPRMRVRAIVAEPLQIVTKMTRGQINTRVDEVIEEVGLNPYQANLYPHEFSGGQRQRIGVARALALNPEGMVLDEPVSALDVSIRAQILNLLVDLQKEHNLAYLMIAHNLATVRYMCHTTAVMYLGTIKEIGDSEPIFTNPLHPYTQALISAALPSHPDIEREEIILPGEVPSPVNPPSGCTFNPRCPVKIGDVCETWAPALTEEERRHWVSCHLYGDAREAFESGQSAPTAPSSDEE
ncbi:MAG: ATP-binding cassette domain-containing protein [Chloroflexi bacterium]|nr:ATP-binding cassette domain-containing protein [Chloroflexota bacterium]